MEKLIALDQALYNWRSKNGKKIVLTTGALGLAVAGVNSAINPTEANAQSNNCNVKVEVKLQAYDDLNGNNKWDPTDPIVGIIPNRQILVSTSNNRDSVILITNNQGVGVSQRTGQPLAELAAICDTKDPNGKPAAALKAKNLNNGAEIQIHVTDSAIEPQPRKITWNAETRATSIPGPTVYPAGIRVAVTGPVRTETPISVTRTATSSPTVTYTPTPSRTPDHQATSQSVLVSATANDRYQKETATAKIPTSTATKEPTPTPTLTLNPIEKRQTAIALEATVLKMDNDAQLQRDTENRNNALERGRTWGEFKDALLQQIGLSGFVNGVGEVGRETAGTFGLGVAIGRFITWPLVVAAGVATFGVAAVGLLVLPFWVAWRIFRGPITRAFNRGREEWRRRRRPQQDDDDDQN